MRAPSSAQSHLTACVCIALSLCMLPASLVILLYAWTGRNRSKKQPTDGRRLTVLINGARATKALTMARVFAKVGHRVILAEEREWATFCASRFSSAVAHFITLPNAVNDREAYIIAMVTALKQNDVDLFVPCSTGNATIEDCAAADRLRKSGSQCKIWAPSEKIASRLHFKDSFTSLCRELGLETAESITITSVDQGVDFLHSTKCRDIEIEGTSLPKYNFILKSIAFGDDAGRSDMTLLPKSTAEQTRRHLSRTPVPIGTETPFVLQRFVEGIEICTHASVWHGELRSFLCCPSSDLLMRYVDIRLCGLEDGPRMAQLAEDWTRKLLHRWAEKLGEGRELLCGHFSFDFIFEPTEDMLYPIECNPRVHTAVALLSSLPDGVLAATYVNDTSAPVRPSAVRPSAAVPARSWLAHALPLSLGQHVLPKSLAARLHPLLLASPRSKTDFIIWSPTPRQTPLRLLSDYLSGREQDASFEIEDPLPWFALAHIHWPWLLLRRLYGRGWSRLNVSTSRIFAI